MRKNLFLDTSVLKRNMLNNDIASFELLRMIVILSKELLVAEAGLLTEIRRQLQ